MRASAAPSRTLSDATVQLLVMRATAAVAAAVAGDASSANNSPGGGGGGKPILLAPLQFSRPSTAPTSQAKRQQTASGARGPPSTTYFSTMRASFIHRSVFLYTRQNQAAELSSRAVVVMARLVEHLRRYQSRMSVAAQLMKPRLD